MIWECRVSARIRMGITLLHNTKKDNIVHFISDFREVNKRLVRKPFPISKISTVLQELDGFAFDTALHLNMDYYTIILDPDASKICTIIFSMGGVFLPQSTDGNCRFSRHFPSKDVQAYGSLRVHENLFG